MSNKDTEKTILKAVKNYFSNGYEYCIKNSFIFRHDWECDFFCVNKEGYSFEIEAKISKADFRNDKKKFKHALFESNPKNAMIPNRFYYAVPRDLIKVEDLPPYAGLIYVDGTHATIVKRAPFIHKKKYDFRKVLCDKFYYQWLMAKRNLHLNEYKLEEALLRIKNLGATRFHEKKGDSKKGQQWDIQTIDLVNDKVVGKSRPNWTEIYKVRRGTRVNVDFVEEIKTFNLKDVEFY